MKILYGVQGTGNGHITRARVMAKYFAKRNDVDVDFIFSGRKPEQYFDMQAFKSFKTFQGLSFVVSHGAIDYWRTATSLKLGQFYQDVKSLDLKQYDLVLNDFEPISAWAARKQKIPAISISHQAAFQFPIPVKGVNVLDRLITRYFAPTDIQLGVHWYHFGHSILPPFIDGFDLTKSNDKSILVYLPFENVAAIQKILEAFAEQDFVCFHPEVKQAHRNENITWHPTAKEPFKMALSRCKGVIANAGFEMASECLHYKKKMLLKPLVGQFEQLSNAFTLSELGLCQIMHTLDIEAIEQWLQIESDAGVQFAADPNILIDWILSKNWSDTKGLCASLWKQVTFSPSVEQSFGQLSA